MFELGLGRPERRTGEAGRGSGGPNRRLALAGPGDGDPAPPGEDSARVANPSQGPTGVEGGRDGYRMKAPISGLNISFVRCKPNYGYKKSLTPFAATVCFS